MHDYQCSKCLGFINTPLPYYIDCDSRHKCLSRVHCECQECDARAPRAFNPFCRICSAPLRCYGRDKIYKYISVPWADVCAKCDNDTLNVCLKLSCDCPGNVESLMSGITTLRDHRSIKEPSSDIKNHICKFAQSEHTRPSLQEAEYCYSEGLYYSALLGD